MGPDYICCSGLHIVQGMDPADTLLAQFNRQQYTEVQETKFEWNPASLLGFDAHIASFQIRLAVSLTKTSFSHISSIVISLPPASELLENPHCGLNARQSSA